MTLILSHHSNSPKRIQNEAILIILGCPEDTPNEAMRHLLNFPIVDNRTIYILLCASQSNYSDGIIQTMMNFVKQRLHVYEKMILHKT